MPALPRSTDPTPEPRPRNPIELNTIAALPRRMPYVFKVEPPEPAPRITPYVFPADLPDPDASARSKVSLFAFLRPATSAGQSSSPENPWEQVAARLDQADDPEAVTVMLAELLERLDDLAERRRERLRKILPSGARAILPLSIGAALLTSHLVLTSLAQRLGLGVLLVGAPWISALLAVPAGFFLTSLILGQAMRRVTRGQVLRIGQTQGRVEASGLMGWRLELADRTRRRLPYYLAPYSGAERLLDHGDSL